MSVLPFAALVPLAWVLSRLFESPVREGVLALGLASTEVAAVGLVALAAGDAALALGALAGSLIVAATLGPLASAAFLALSAVPALAWARLVGDDQRPAVAFAVGLRDFAVAATLAIWGVGAQ